MVNSYAWTGISPVIHSVARVFYILADPEIKMGLCLPCLPAPGLATGFCDVWFSFSKKDTGIQRTGHFKGDELELIDVGTVEHN